MLKRVGSVQRGPARESAGKEAVCHPDSLLGKRQCVTQTVSGERGGVSPRESAGKEAIRRGSDRKHKGAHVTGCHFVRLGCRMA